MPIIDPEEVERTVVDGLVDALEALPQAWARRLSVGMVYEGTDLFDAWTNGSGYRVDAAIELSVANTTHMLLVEVKKNIYPRDAQQAMWQMQHYLKHLDVPNAVPLLAAQVLSPGAKALLAEEGVGYYDIGGSLYVPAPGAYIYIEKPPPKPLVRMVRSLFTGKRAQVLHVLLHDVMQRLSRSYNDDQDVPEGWLGVKMLAEMARVSPSMVSETLSTLDRFNWLETRGKGPSKERRLIEPGALLDEWKKHVLAMKGRGRVRRYYVSTPTAEDLMDRLDELCEVHNVDYAFTREAAAQIYAPYLSKITQVSCRMRASNATAQVLEDLGAHPVTEGANLIVHDTQSAGEYLFRERHRTDWLASPIQVYLDLMQGGGRAMEMADHLRHERIGF